eukprot:GHVS01019838.1.p1 GENE.GHVS01019838.1~~GHVS01019838.1.p1  ORF type:complete len:230 (+),score=41.87 GHVS01019838.1:233-922(+)
MDIFPSSCPPRLPAAAATASSTAFSPFLSFFLANHPNTANPPNPPNKLSHLPLAPPPSGRWAGRMVQLSYWLYAAGMFALQWMDLFAVRMRISCARPPWPRGFRSIHRAIFRLYRFVRIVLIQSLLLPLLAVISAATTPTTPTTVEDTPQTNTTANATPVDTQPANSFLGTSARYYPAVPLARRCTALTEVCGDVVIVDELIHGFCLDSKQTESVVSMSGSLQHTHYAK